MGLRKIFSFFSISIIVTTFSCLQAYDTPDNIAQDAETALIRASDQFKYSIVFKGKICKNEFYHPHQEIQFNQVPILDPKIIGFKDNKIKLKAHGNYIILLEAVPTSNSPRKQIIVLTSNQNSKLNFSLTNDGQVKNLIFQRYRSKVGPSPSLKLRSGNKNLSLNSLSLTIYHSVLTENPNPPSIENFFPEFGTSNRNVTIRGKNFISGDNDSLEAYFNDKPAIVINVTQIVNAIWQQDEYSALVLTPVFPPTTQAYITLYNNEYPYPNGSQPSSKPFTYVP